LTGRIPPFLPTISSSWYHLLLWLGLSLRVLFFILPVARRTFFFLPFRLPFFSSVSFLVVLSKGFLSFWRRGLYFFPREVLSPTGAQRVPLVLVYLAAFLTFHLPRDRPPLEETPVEVSSSLSPHYPQRERFIEASGTSSRAVFPKLFSASYPPGIFLLP